MNDQESDAVRILSLLLASGPGQYEQSFLALARDEEGHDLLAARAADSLLWWRLRGQEPTFDVKGLLLACLGIRLAARRANGESVSHLWELMTTQVMGITPSSTADVAPGDFDTSQPEAWHYLSRIVVAGVDHECLPAQDTAARQACSSLIDCDFVTAARALTVLGSLNAARRVDSEEEVELNRFHARATNYLNQLAATLPHSWIAWETQLMASQMRRADAYS